MKRFKVSNIHGQAFQVESESLEKVYGEKLPPEWGKPAYTEEKLVEPEARDKAGEVSKEAVYEKIEHKSEYTIIEEDITQEIADKEAAKAAKKSGIEQAKALKGKKKRSAAEVDLILDALIEALAGGE